MRIRTLPPRILLALLIGLLAVLGTLQYRWSGALSAAERVRMRAGAQERADSFARELDRELTRAFLRLGFPGASSEAPAFAERFERWQQGTAHPRLVADVFLAEADGRLLRYHDRAFAPVEWPAAWRPLRNRVAGGEPRARDETAGPFAFLPDGTPVLQLPVLPSPPARPSTRMEVVRWGPLASLLIVLDLGYVREHLLPDLAQRHFGGADGLEYTLAVTRTDQPAPAVWRSAPPAGDRVDAAAGLLELRPDELDDEDVRDVMRPRGGVFVGPPTREARGSMAWSFSKRLDTGRERGLHLLRRGRWQLSATHRAGSLDAVVTASRRRNLTVGFGILVLLGASAALLVTSARRAERLAHRQIEFVAGVTHELRTPLAVIRSAGENLADGLIDEPAQVRRYGELVRDEGRRLTAMVEQALELAGAESGRLADLREPLSIARLLEDTLREWRAHAGVPADADVPADLPPVLGDEAALRRALRNLLDNAVKYGGDTPWVGVRAQAQGQEVEVTVEDQGPGIPADERAQVFEPFYRGRDARSRRIHGSGLGLSLVRRIVESHGGNVRIEDRRAGGTAFTVTLPALQGTAS